MALRIPSVSPLGETRPRPPPPYRKKKKRKPPPNQNRMRGGEARAERNSRSGGRLSYPTVWWSGGCAVTEFVVERTITFHITTFSERATFITSLCFENRFGLGTINTQKQLSPEHASGRLLFLPRGRRESERGAPSEHAGSREQGRETFWSDGDKKCSWPNSPLRHQNTVLGRVSRQ